jgi:hypothetical protein
LVLSGFCRRGNPFWRHQRFPIAPIVIRIVIRVGVGIVRIIPPVGIVPPIIPPVRITPPAIAISPVISVVATTESPMRASATCSVASTTMTPGINGLH